jgi:hypothetical protein
VKAAAALAAAALAAALVLAGCSSSGGTATAPATPKPTVTSGTETITGTITGAAAVAGNPAFRLTFRGPVNTTATTVPGGSIPAKGQHRTFATAAGNLAVVVSGTVTAVPMLLSASACRYSFTTIVSYTVDGHRSTGKFADAAGHGTVTLTEQADDPKLASGQCNESPNAPPAAGTVTGTLTGGGPLTVKK